MTPFKYTATVKKIAVETKAINKAIKSVATASAALAPRIQAVLIACAYHAVEHKDASLVTNLWNSLGNSVNKRNGINAWLRKYTSLVLTTDKAGVAKFLGKNKEYTFDIAGETVAFYDMPEVEAANSKPFDIIAWLGTAVKRIEAANKKGEIKGAKPKALFFAIEKLADEYAPKEEAKTKPKASTPTPPRKQGSRPAANMNVRAEPVAA